MILTAHDQSAELPRYLERFRRLSVLPYDEAAMTRRSVSCLLPASFDLRDARALWNFEIFPARHVRSFAEWELSGRSMRVGDTIVQQVTLPGSTREIPRVVVGVRVCEVLRSPRRIAFAYEALRGHAEAGLTQFAVEEDHDGNKRFAITRWARPRRLVARLGAQKVFEQTERACLHAGLSHFAAACCNEAVM